MIVRVFFHHIFHDGLLAPTGSLVVKVRLAAGRLAVEAPALLFCGIVDSVMLEKTFEISESNFFPVLGRDQQMVP